MENKQVSDLLLEQLRLKRLDVDNDALNLRVMTWQEEIDCLRENAYRYNNCGNTTKADRCCSEIAFFVEHNLVRHLCLVALDFYERHGHMDWAPIGFQIKGGNAREIQLRFRYLIPGDRHFGYYYGVLRREYDRGERYELVVEKSPDGESFRMTAVFDILNVLNVPRAYIDGLFDMVEYGNAKLEEQKNQLDKETEEQIEEHFKLRGIVNSLRADLRKLSQQMKAIKKPKKWLQKRFPRGTSYEPPTMPSPPTEVMTSREAQINYANQAGIYFLWDASGKCAYVGKSKNVGNRLGSHEKSHPDCAVSVLPLHVTEIHFAELYYIWLMRPPRNGEGIETAAEIEKLQDSAEVETVTATSFEA